ncbi:MAG: phytoene/squalene synthase family protein [Pirellulales bacterium]|nr:phytoene/squalene synthase family protein [Pirellulales bacterium]
MTDLDASYAHCQRLARGAASNFYFSFLLLPREKRQAMCALYAYLRHVDDLADDESRSANFRSVELNELKTVISSPDFRAGNDPILPALADTMKRYSIPIEYLTAAIDGVKMDIAGTHYKTFEELEKYCYRVASVVGLACIHIWGFRGTQVLELASRCGTAFQLTNILRDLTEDAESGRCYLPQEDLERFGYSFDDLRRQEVSDRFRNLMDFETVRAEQYFAAAAELEPLLERDGQRAFRAMATTYGTLLKKIKQHPTAILFRRVRLSRWEKLRIAAGALFHANRQSQSVGLEWKSNPR